MIIESKGLDVGLGESIEYLAELCHGEGDLALLKAYFDESGIHKGSPVCVVSGFVAPSKRVLYLSHDWQVNVLFKHGIDYFHAKDFAQRNGQFKGWDAEKIREFSIDAVSAIFGALGYEERMIAVAISCKDFFALSTDERRWLTGGLFVHSEKSNKRKWKKQGAPTKPYFLLLQHAVFDAVKQTEDKDFSGRFKGTGDLVHFFFDQQSEYESTALSICNSMRQSSLSVSSRIGDVAYTSKHRAVSLQVADFLAYESFCYLAKREETGTHELSESGARMFRWLHSRQVFIDGHTLQALLRHAPLTPKKRFVPPDPNH